MSSSSQFTVVIRFPLEYCKPLKVITAFGKSSDVIDVKFYAPWCMNSVRHRGYVLLYKKTFNATDPWKSYFYLGCEGTNMAGNTVTRSIDKLEPVTNYTILVMVTAFKGVTLTSWPPVYATTHVGRKSNSSNTFTLKSHQSQVSPATSLGI